MRTVEELVGLAVVGEGTGNRVGRIQDILFEPQTGSIAGFLVHPGGLFHKPLLLSRQVVRSLGTDALIIEPTHVLEEITSDPAIPGTVAAKSLDGRPVLDDQGTYQGKATDFAVAEDTLSIVGMHYSTGILSGVLHKQPLVPFSSIKAIGADSIVIPTLTIKAETAPGAETTQTPT